MIGFLHVSPVFAEEGFSSGSLLFPQESAVDEQITEGTGSVIEVEPAMPVISPLLVRINEVMWMGSDLSTSDEWIELTAVPAFTGSVLTEPLNLDGWTVLAVKDGAEIAIARFSTLHSIQSGAYLVISNNAAPLSRLRAEPALVTAGISLPNTKLLLRLRDGSGNLVDEVDDGIGAPFAGANPSGGVKASMERIDIRVPGVLQSNWRTASTQRGWDSASAALGTPGFLNASVEPPDTAAPLDATDLRAFMWSGSVLLAWNRSVSGDVEQQRMTVVDKGVSRELSFPPDSGTAIIAGGAETVLHQSLDASGHSSKGVLIQVQPLHKPIIDEVLPDPVGSDTIEWIELSNPYTTPLDLRGWALQSGTKTFMLQGSGVVLAPGAHMLFTAQQTGLTLPNAGGEVRLSFLGQIIDRLSYPALPEGVSMGMIENTASAPLCIAQPFSTNRIIPVSVAIDGLDVPGASTLNLAARALSGSLTGAQCYWEYGDGHTYSGCNPPSHAMKLSGERTLTLKVTDYCGKTVLHTRSVFVSGKAKSLSVEPQESRCTPSASNAIRITEVYPAPSPGEDEWIELQNSGTGSVSLCGWSLDDEEGGSKPFALGNRVLEPGHHLLVSGKESRIALNNDQDHVRLLGPLAGGGTGTVMMVPFHHAQSARAYAVRSDGEWLWTPFVTPGSVNSFKEVSSDQPAPTVVLEAAIPNPSGVDTGNEWIELKNLTTRPQWLNGWLIETTSGKSLDLTGIVLAKNESKRHFLNDSFALGNTYGSLRLIDDVGRIRSVLAWQKPTDGAVIRRFEGLEPLYPTRVTVLDSLKLRSTFIFDTDDRKTLHLSAALAGVRAGKSGNSIEYKNTLSALIENKKIELQSDTNGSIFYVYADGVELTPLLLQMGYGYVPADQPFEKRSEYLVYEQDARTNKRGIWSTHESAAAIDREREGEAMDAVFRKEGLTLFIDPPSGLVSSGQVLSVLSNVPAELLIAMGTGAFTSFSGSMRIPGDGIIRMMGEYQMRTGSGETIRSTVTTREYTMLKDRYVPCVRISEVYPSPKSGEKEWLELSNVCDEQITMVGWAVDDEAGAGSKVQTFGTGIVLLPHSLLVLSGSHLKLSLNNGGDGVTVLMPNSRVSDSIWYPSIKKGRAYASAPGGYCLTDEPTPGASNKCLIKVPLKKSKKAASKKLSIGLKTIFKFMTEGLPSMDTKRAHGFTLYEGLESKNDPKNIVGILWLWLVLSLLGGLCFYLYAQYRQKHASLASK